MASVFPALIANYRYSNNNISGLPAIEPKWGNPRFCDGQHSEIASNPYASGLRRNSVGAMETCKV
jgi:hypothetical protein